MRFKLDWASLVVGRKFTVFALFYFVFEGNLQGQAPRGANIWRGDLTAVFCVTSLGGLRLEGLIHGGAYFRNFTVFSLETSCLWYSIKCQTRGVPEVICAQSHTTTCMSRHNSRWLARLVPHNNPINACALSLGPRLSLFSEVSYYWGQQNRSLYRGLRYRERFVISRFHCIEQLVASSYLEFFHEKRGLGFKISRK